MTIQEVAARMNGRQYLFEITPNEEKELKEDGIVVVYGYSDDNVEVRGAINEEVGGYEKIFIPFFKGKILYLPCRADYECNVDATNCPFYRELVSKVYSICAMFKGEGWVFKTDIPHEEFSIMEDGELFGKGIAFYLKDIGGES